MTKEELSIFLFHGVIEKQIDPVRNYTKKHIEKELFASCIKLLSEKGTPLSMDPALHHLENQIPFPKNAFALTFDDGFENNVSVAAPILTDYKVPATIYVTSNFIEICVTQVLLGVSFAFFLVGGLRTAEVNGNKIGMVGTATGLFQASFSVSQLIGPSLAIVIYTRYETYTSIMNIAGLITLGGTVLYLILMKLKS